MSSALKIVFAVNIIANAVSRIFDLRFIEQSSESLFRKRFESTLHTSTIKHLRWYEMNCSELREGQVLSCEGCGFELRVETACKDEKCSTDTCCTGNIVSSQSSSVG